jgi:hypothetical protein
MVEINDSPVYLSHDAGTNIKLDITNFYFNFYFNLKQKIKITISKFATKVFCP